jgi:hypothetical protein
MADLRPFCGAKRTSQMLRKLTFDNQTSPKLSVNPIFPRTAPDRTRTVWELGSPLRSGRARRKHSLNTELYE